MKLSTLLDLIDNGSIRLPEFQRGYVWNRDQVRGLMRSLYFRYPVGNLLLWQAKAEDAKSRGGVAGPPGYVDLLLDGQQRITSLYGIIRGRPPIFFEGNERAFTSLHFNLDEQTFEFYAPGKMKSNPLWIDVTSLMKDGIGSFVTLINDSEELRPRLEEYIQRLNSITSIKDKEFQQETITGQEDIDVVVEIFDRVNSGGTKLSKADLALAKLCAAWPEARNRLREALKRWRQFNFNFKIDWLLRVITSVGTGDALFTKLSSLSPKEFEAALARSEKALDTLLNNVSSHLGLDHDRVLAGRYGFAVMARYLDNQGGKFPDATERNKLLYWYVQSFLWARYVGSSETVLNQDLDSVDDGGVDFLIERLREWRGDLTIGASNFSGYSLGARFYPLLYMLTRVRGARDFWNGAPELSAHMLGKLSTLQVHHIFPKDRLYKAGYRRGEVNAITNYCYLTQDTNLWVLNREPRDYFKEVEEKYPGALASQWIPLDPTLWEIDHYPQFLEARRELLANASNSFLNSLLIPASGPAQEVEMTPRMVVVEEEEEAEPADQEVLELIGWLEERGYGRPELDVEIPDPATGETIAIAEAAWLNGVQDGLGEPVLIDLEMNEESEARLTALGYKVFPSAASMKEFVERSTREKTGEALPVA